MHNPNPVPGAAARESRETDTEDHGPSTSGPAKRDAENPAPARPADSPAQAQGRRTLSTAFVMMGPDGHLTVELHDGRAMILRDVVMRPKDFCGVQVLEGSTGDRYCGGYGDVAAARPGGMPAPDVPTPVAINPAKGE